MSEGTPILIPRESVNDDSVTLVRWHFQTGRLIKTGEPLLDIETTKAVMTIAAETDGFLEILRREGESVMVGVEVGLLHASSSKMEPSSRSVAGAPSEAGSLDRRFSRKAKALIEELGLDATAFAHLALVRESDVQELLEKRKAQLQAPEAPCESDVVLPEASETDRPRGFFAEARASAKNRGWNMFHLAWNYLFRNYLLNLAVRFAPVGLIITLHRLRGAKIGQDCFIDPTAQIETAYPENLTIGNDVRITAHAVIMSHIKAPHYLRQTGMIPFLLKPVVLEDHCFIGVNAVVMPGVRVGKASVVASGAVVLNDVPPFTMVAGNPARIVKRFPAAGRSEPSIKPESGPGAANPDSGIGS
jgi:acetyltransferase-like isoleucine patch superfamily enzyme